MNTTTRVFSALAATTLGAGLALMAAGAPATAAAASAASPLSACQGVGGFYEPYNEDWYCTYSALAGFPAPSLTAACSGTPYAWLIDDGNPTGTVTFFCNV